MDFKKVESFRNTLFFLYDEFIPLISAIFSKKNKKTHIIRLRYNYFIIHLPCEKQNTIFDLTNKKIRHLKFCK